MKVRLTMELDIPESHYRDDEEDVNVPPKDLPKLHISFIRDEIFRNLTNFATLHHMRDAMEWMVEDHKDPSISKKHIIKEHNTWAEILRKSLDTVKVEPVFDLEAFKKEFDSYLDSKTDEELIAEFAKLDCEVEVKKEDPRYGGFDFTEDKHI